jgi:signal transduction histidine kinase
MRFDRIAPIFYLTVSFFTANNAAADMPMRSVTQLEARLVEIDSELNDLARYSLRSGYGTIGWRSIAHDAPQHTEWIQIELSEPTTIDQIVLVPAIMRNAQSGYQAEGFPLEFRIIAGSDDDPHGKVINRSYSDHAQLPRYAPVIIPVPPTNASWVRIEATKLSSRSWDGKYLLQLSEILVFNGYQNVALHQAVQTSSSSVYSDLPYQKHFLVDGFMPYLMDAAQGQQSLAFLASIRASATPSFIIDLGAPQAINRLHLHAMDVSDTVPQAVPTDLGIPSRLLIEGANKADFSDTTCLLQYERRTVYDTGPIIMQRFPKTICRYVKLTAFNPFILAPDSPRSARIGFAEIELFAEHQNVALTRPVMANVPESADRKLEALTDGRNLYGDILPTRTWLEQLSRRHELESERPLVEQELNQRYLRQKTNLNRMIWLSVLLGGGILITILIERMRSMRQTALIRERFAADLHDELGANIHTMGLLSDVALNAMNSPQRLLEVLERNRELIRRTGTAVRHCINLQEANGLLANLPEDVERLAQRTLAELNYEIKIEGEPFLHHLKHRTRDDLRLFFKECLVNISRHADATTVLVRLNANRKGLTLSVSDDGRGMAGSIEDAIPASLKRRARLLGAKVTSTRSKSDGTCITLKLKFPWLSRPNKTRTPNATPHAEKTTSIQS